MTTRKIGLLIGGTEEDWPTALEMLFRRFDPIITLSGGEPMRVDIERVRVHPFDLRAGTPYDLVIDRLSHWQLNPASGSRRPHCSTRSICSTTRSPFRAWKSTRPTSP